MKKTPVKKWPLLFSLPWMKKFDAIAFPWAVYVRYLPISERLLKHETVHLQQWKRGWYVGFAFMYLFYFLKGLKRYRDADAAYFNHPYEIEAREGEWL